MDDPHINTIIDLTNVPKEVTDKAKGYANLMQDMLAEQEGITNFYALYAALLLAGANLAVICMSRDDPSFPSLLGWSTAVLDGYSEQVRTSMRPNPGEKVH